MASAGSITERQKIGIHSEQCSGCRYCQLACSFAKTGSFGWEEARIKVLRMEGKERYRVEFAENCDRCGFCVKYCYYAVLGENDVKDGNQ